MELGDRGGRRRASIRCRDASNAQLASVTAESIHQGTLIPPGNVRFDTLRITGLVQPDSAAAPNVLRSSTVEVHHGSMNPIEHPLDWWAYGGYPMVMRELRCTKTQARHL